MEILGLSALALITIILVLAFEVVNGFHDSANSIATIVATRVLPPAAAVGMAAVCNFAGVLIGTNIAATIGKGIIDQNLLWADYGVLLIFCAVMGAIVWDLITWWFGIPTSSSHALIGGLIGAGGAVMFVDAIVWSGTSKAVIFMIVSPLAGLIVAFLVTALVMRGLKRLSRTTVNKYFRKLQILSSASYSIGHGANDAQKGMGIIAMLLLMEQFDSPTSEFVVPLWVKIACCTCIALGTFFGGWRIVRTMASKITHLDPYQGFCAETGAASLLFTTAHFGIPVSTTHTISGAIMGVGATKSLSAVRWGVGKKIVTAWVLTIPAAATISGILFVVLRPLMGL